MLNLRQLTEFLAAELAAHPEWADLTVWHEADPSDYFSGQINAYTDKLFLN